MFELGGHAIVLSAQGSQIARGEPVADTARVLSGYCHAIMLRTFAQARVDDMVAHASVPVINGLSDDHHPCQLAADLLTVLDRCGDDLTGQRYAWIGDGNNMANSWIEAAGLFGLHLRLACPDGFAPDPAYLATHAARAATRGGSIHCGADPVEAARDATVVSTDVWASMGQEDDAARRRLAFRGYIVDEHLLSGADPRAIVLHCLPAHRGEEIAASVIDAPASAVWAQAHNRMHAQKALLELLLGATADWPSSTAGPRP